tara:strand:+ start:376 stop:528 length:153 start_codon:yes stop_codon:yes gene_type:complete
LFFPDHIVVSDEPSLFAQEMILRLKQEIRKMGIIFFIYPSMPKVKYYSLF